MSGLTSKSWHYRPDSLSNPGDHPSGDYMIGDCEHLPDNIAVCTTIEHARLIASAPEILEALNMLLEHYTALVNCGDCGNWNPEKEFPVIAARAAISKATGGEK